MFLCPISLDHHAPTADHADRWSSSRLSGQYPTQRDAHEVICPVPRPDVGEV